MDGCPIDRPPVYQIPRPLAGFLVSQRRRIIAVGSQLKRLSTVARWLALIPLAAAAALAGILTLPRVIETLLHELNPGPGDE